MQESHNPWESAPTVLQWGSLLGVREDCWRLYIAKKEEMVHTIQVIDCCLRILGHYRFHSVQKFYLYKPIFKNFHSVIVEINSFRIY